MRISSNLKIFTVNENQQLPEVNQDLVGKSCGQHNPLFGQVHSRRSHNVNQCANPNSETSLDNPSSRKGKNDNTSHGVEELSIALRKQP